MSDHIQYDFLYDNHFAEMKDSELMTERVNLAVIADPYVGRYYSADYVRRKILRQTDEEIIEQDKLIALEIENGITIDPLAPMPDMEEEMGEDSISNMQDPELDNSATEIKLPKGGEI